jgi:dipeptidyl-peptidase 4
MPPSLTARVRRTARQLPFWLAPVVALALLAAPAPASPQAGRPVADIDIDRFIHPAFPSGLVSATGADRIAWLSNERGLRNVYTAVAPDFSPVRITSFSEDDGIELSSLAISRDGRVVVFVRGIAPNRDGWVANPASLADGVERAIWAATTDGRGAWRLGEGASPELSPDGRWVVFARDGQLHRMEVSRNPGATPADRGEVPFIRVWGRNAGPRWSPDGSRLAFVSNRVDHSYVVVYDVASHRISYIAPGVDFDSSPTWSPDGARLAFIRRPGLPFGRQAHGGPATLGNPVGPANAGPPQNPAAIPGLMNAAFRGGHTMVFMVADVRTGEAREFWRNERDDRLFPTLNSIVWAGDNVIFQHEPEEWSRVYTVALDGSTPRPVELTPGEGAVETMGLSADGRTLFYATNAGDIDRRHVWSVPTAGGRAAPVTTGQGIEMSPAPLASGRQVALLSATYSRPLSVAVVPVSTGEPQVLFPTLTAAFPTAAHVQPEAVTLNAEDGFEFYNQLFVPRDIRPGERRPAVVYVHGGPIRQMLLGYHYGEFYHMSYAVNQWLVSQGYVVLSVNYRLGIGYGRSFRNAPNSGARGNAEYLDVLAAGRYLQGRSDVDPERIGIWGLSYGGILTAHALARNSDIFKAGVDMAGVHLWGSSLDPEDLAFRSSPISAVDGWTSPVLIWHGDDDRNVQFSQTTGLVQLLRARDVHYELIIYPDDTHATMLYSRWLHTWRAMDDFLNRFLRVRN